MSEMSVAEREVRVVLDSWADGIGRHDPARVAKLFTDDALFQGFDPAPGYGRDYISSYYEKQPIGLSATYELQSVRALTPELTLAYARVDFDRPDGSVRVYLTVVAELVRGQWAIRHYHVSKQMGG
jgi:uncharacterized protein (TIGR02246 family)